MMYRILKEKRAALRELRLRRKALVQELRSKHKEKKTIEQQMATLRREIKEIKGDGRQW